MKIAYEVIVSRGSSEIDPSQYLKMLTNQARSLNYDCFAISPYIDRIIGRGISAPDPLHSTPYLCNFNREAFGSVLLCFFHDISRISLLSPSPSIMQKNSILYKD